MRLVDGPFVYFFQGLDRMSVDHVRMERCLLLFPIVCRLDQTNLSSVPTLEKHFHTPQVSPSIFKKKRRLNNTMRTKFSLNHRPKFLPACAMLNPAHPPRSFASRTPCECCWRCTEAPRDATSPPRPST